MIYDITWLKLYSSRCKHDIHITKVLIEKNNLKEIQNGTVERLKKYNSTII